MKRRSSPHRAADYSRPACVHPNAWLDSVTTVQLESHCLDDLAGHPRSGKSQRRVRSVRVGIYSIIGMPPNIQPPESSISAAHHHPVDDDRTALVSPRQTHESGCRQSFKRSPAPSTRHHGRSAHAEPESAITQIQTKASSGWQQHVSVTRWSIASKTRPRKFPTPRHHPHALVGVNRIAFISTFRPTSQP